MLCFDFVSNSDYPDMIWMLTNLWYLSFIVSHLNEIYCWQKDKEVEDFRMKFAGSQADRIERAEAEEVELAEQLKKK